MSDSKFNNWKPIKSIPKDGREVLVTNGEFVAIGAWLPDYQRAVPFHYDEANNAWWDLAFWDYLPEPPK